MKFPKPTKRKQIPLKRAKTRAWDAFAKWYRRNAIGKNGYAICYTCDKITSYENIQPGHWMTGHTNTNYINVEYIRPQCSYCNVILKGNQGIFWERIEDEIGTEKFMYLRLHSKDFLNLTSEDYLELERIYKDKLSSLI